MDRRMYCESSSISAWAIQKLRGRPIDLFLDFPIPVNRIGTASHEPYLGRFNAIYKAPNISLRKPARLLASLTGATTSHIRT
jgi:hypothetical protein